MAKEFGSRADLVNNEAAMANNDVGNHKLKRQLSRTESKRSEFETVRIIRLITV